MTIRSIIAFLPCVIFCHSLHAASVYGQVVVQLKDEQIVEESRPILQYNKLGTPSAQLSDIEVAAYEFINGEGSLSAMMDDDPWLNIRYELVNQTTQQQFFSLDMRFPTVTTSGSTVKDAFMNIELIDVNNAGDVYVSNSTSSFTVIEDDGGPTVNGDSIAQSPSFQLYSGEGVHSVFDVTGSGPNSDLIIGSSGFNYIRFLTNGDISPGDKLIITAYGCYANDAGDCPERFTIPASAVPVPAAVWLFGSGLLALIGMSRHKKAG